MRARFRTGSARAVARAAGWWTGVLCALLLGGILQAAQAQQQAPPSDTTASDTTRADTTAADTTAADTARADTAVVDPARPASSDSLAPALPGAQGPPGGSDGAPADGAVEWSARDSLVFVFAEEDQETEGDGDVGSLYGQAQVQREEVTLTAYQVRLLFDRGVLRADSPPDSVQADSLAFPRFQRGEGEAFTGRTLSYNTQTERGRIVAARTQAQEQEGFVSGEAVRVEEDSTLFIRGGSYTTCDCPRDETPSYSLRSNKMKVQGDWVYTGPIQLFIYNIPTPVLLPFAFLPATPGRHGGIIPPGGYGRDDELGLFLQDFGYYWPISDYMDFQLTGSLWSRGSWGVEPFLRYERRYHYRGNVRLDYTRNVTGDLVDTDFVERSSASFVWSHRQQFTPRDAPNASSLNANVNLASEVQRRIVSDDFNDNVTQRTSSTISFSKDWNDGNQNLDVDVRQSQTFTSGQASLTLPRVGFRQRTFQPFKPERRGAGEDERWYEKITVGYRGNARNRFDFNPLTDERLRQRGDTTDTGEVVDLGVAWYDALFSQEDYFRATGDAGQRFDFSATHDVPINATFRLPRYRLNVTPRIDYEEEWFPSTERRERAFDENGRATVVEREEAGFFAAREVRLSTGVNTTFYGLFPFRVGALEGLRHEVQPSLRFAYEPDYTTDFFGRTRSYIDEDGEAVRYDIVTGNDIRNTGGQRSLRFGIDNEFETKQVRIDSTGARQEETLRLLALDADATYNFAADSLRLSDIDVRLDFPVLQTKFNIDAGARLEFSPYVFNDRGSRLDRTVLGQTGLYPVRLTDFDLSISTDFQGGDQGAGNRFGSGNFGNGSFGRGGFGVDRTTGGAPQVPDPTPTNVPGRPSLRQGVEQYANFAVPWSLRLRLSYGFDNQERFEQSEFLLNADFSFNVTPRWKVSGVSGYDFDQGELTATRFNITRDFQCWQMALTWNPFGINESYSFSLYVKSGVLRDLLNLRLPRDQARGFGDRVRGVASGVGR